METSLCLTPKPELVEEIMKRSQSQELACVIFYYDDKDNNKNKDFRLCKGSMTGMRADIIGLVEGIIHTISSDSADFSKIIGSLVVRKAKRDCENT